MIILWQTGFLLWGSWIKKSAAARRLFPKIIIAYAIAGLLWLPWLGFAFQSQTNKVLNMTQADLNAGLLTLLLKIGHSVFSFGIGETIFPWHPLAVIALIALVILGLIAFVELWRRSSDLVWWAGTFVILSILITAFITSYLIGSAPFIAFANHILFVLPFFWLWLAAGLATIPNQLIRWLLIVTILLGHTTAIVNYYQVRDFHNPIYMVPTREIVSNIAQNFTPDHIIIAANDTGIDYYARQIPLLKNRVLAPGDTASAILNEEKPARVWLVVFGRDRTRSPREETTKMWLEERYDLVETQGYAEQSSVYRQVKEFLFRRPAYLYKLTLYEYELKQ